MIVTSDSESIVQQHFGETMEITVVNRYILTAAQSLGSQDYQKKLLGLAGVLFCENEHL